MQAMSDPQDRDEDLDGLDEADAAFDRGRRPLRKFQWDEHVIPADEQRVRTPSRRPVRPQDEDGQA